MRPANKPLRRVLSWILLLLLVALGNFVAKENWSFWEVYAKGVWTITDQWALGFNVFGTSNILNTGASGTYVSGTAKYTAPTPPSTAAIRPVTSPCA